MTCPPAASAPPTAARTSGVLLHPTSLAGGHGIGDLGPEAHRFVDFLAEARQGLWQLLPLGPPGFGESPYAARSAFAGNPLLLSLDRLVDEGLLEAADLAPAPPLPADRIAFAEVERFKLGRLRRAFERFRRGPGARDRLEAFRRARPFWIEPYALFMALRDAHGGRAWTEWPAPLRHPRSPEVAEARRRLADEVDLHVFVQLLFDEQWGALRRHAHARGVRLVGDVPIFVAHDSAGVWAYPELFLLDDQGQPTEIAGVPPDAFSATGQRWGNPLYRWDVLARRGYDWWIERMRSTLAAVDAVRIDHFRGFHACWYIPAADATAERGRWVEVPGAALFAALRAALGDFAVIAEDLGVITPAVEALRERLGFPGMKILQFAFGGGPDNPYLPHNARPDCVVYTGTHDNDTTAGWYASAPFDVQDHVRRYLAVPGQDVVWDLIRAAMASVADTAIVPLQDLLGVGAEGRMNTPGRSVGNWSWRVGAGQLTPALAARLAEVSALYGRTPAGAGIFRRPAP